MTYAKIALKNEEVSSLGLTEDEAGAIACYTLQPKGSKPIYEVINEILAGSRNRANLNTSRRLLYLLLSGLRKLPRFRPSAGQQFYRGIRCKVPQTKEEAAGHQYYAKGLTVTWWGFTSTTTDFDVVNTFIEDAPERTLFIIGGADLWGYNIKPFSSFSDEEEILLEPESNVLVNGVVPGTPLTVNVTLQKLDHLVLEDIIPVASGLGQAPPNGTQKATKETKMKYPNVEAAVDCLKRYSKDIYRCAEALKALVDLTKDGKHEKPK